VARIIPTEEIQLRPAYLKKNKPPAPAKDFALETDLEGAVDNIVYRSDDTGYTVCAVRIDKRPDPVTVVGKCPVIWVGETLKAHGKWVRHKQHGHQFQADTLICIAPTSIDGIRRFLAGGLIKGVGDVTAKRIVEKFGADTLNIIEHESSRLEEVDGIGRVRRQMIKESWNEQRGVRDIMIFLQSHGVGPAQATRIFKQYGSKAISMISENPYRLCREIWGVGFKTADSVAQSIGIPANSGIRARAGLIYTLQTMTDEGHCFCNSTELLLMAQQLLEIPVEILAPALEEEVKTGALTRDNNRIYITDLYVAETGVAKRLGILLRTPPGFQPIVVEKAVPWAEQRMKIAFAPRQSEALRLSISSKVSMITGGPGVGKTTIIRALVDVFMARNLIVCLAAPTGRAAKRMEEATGHPASTIHRLLKYQPREGHFEHTRSNPVDGHVFIVDEMSMIDLPLFNSLLQALPDSAHVVLVGDPDQLPSVGPGNVLKDMLAAGTIGSSRLETIFRQQTGGWIVQNAHAVNEGKNFTLPAEGEESDFFFVESSEPDQVIDHMRNLVTTRIPKKFGFNPLNDIQVLTPMRKNQLGADNLNMVLQEALNPAGRSVERFGRAYREGDRVMQIRNNYDKVVFNGDIGRIARVDTEEQKLVVDFDGTQVGYDFPELDELVLAYACSIHKSQGSEYPAVVVLISTQHYKLLQRNLLYTAITRGRKLVCVVGSSKAIGMAIRNNKIYMRRTALAQRLSGRPDTINDDPASGYYSDPIPVEE